MPQLVIDPIPKCNHLYEGTPDTNWGGGDVLEVRFVPQPKGADIISRSIMDADISAIPGGETINPTSKLELYCWSIQTASAATIHRITEAGWTEYGSTWNDSDAPTPWATPGGDYSSPTVPFTTPASLGWSTITGEDLAAFLQNALDNWGGIARMLLKVDAEHTLKGGGMYWSDDKPGLEPKLTVDYGVAAPYIRPVKLLQP